MATPSGRANRFRALFHHGAHGAHGARAADGVLGSGASPLPPIRHDLAAFLAGPATAPAGAAHDTARAPTGLFGFPELTRPDGFVAAADTAHAAIGVLIDAIAASTHPADSAETVTRLDALSDVMCAIVDASEIIRTLHPDPAWRDAAAAGATKLSDLLNQLNTHVGLYAALCRAMDHPDPAVQAVVRRPDAHAVATLLRRDFEHAGVALPEHQRQQCVAQQNAILQLGWQFLAEPIPDPATATFALPAARTAGIPAHVLAQLPRRDTDGVYLVPPAAFPGYTILQTAHDPAVRRAMYVALHSATAEQTALLEALLDARAALAQQLGAPSYAHLALAGKMAERPERVTRFLDACAAANGPAARAAVARLAAQRDGAALSRGAPLAAWDRAYYAAQAPPSPARQAAHATLAAAGTFSLGAVMAGIAHVLDIAFGLALAPEPLAPGEAWHPDVRKLRVTAARGAAPATVGFIYCDLLQRPDGARKAAMPTHFTLRCSRRLHPAAGLGADAAASAGSPLAEALAVTRTLLRQPDAVQLGGAAPAQLPLVVLATDWPAHADGTARLAPSAIVTLLHEMGHAVHSMLARTAYQHISGTRVAVDSVEIASTLMEKWAAAAAAPSRRAGGAASGPSGLADQAARLAAAMHVLHATPAPIDTQAQLQLALMDQLLHGPCRPAPADTPAALAALAARAGVFPYVAGTQPHATFPHLVSYGATYYTYVWCQRWSNRLWAAHFAPPEAAASAEAVAAQWAQAGQALDAALLGWGGGRDAWEGLDALGVVRPGERGRDGQDVLDAADL
ncbi:hypothetical protein CXG81DRAFT_15535 [Caulochytrium protostelioides]|uniref:Peptidase M3A/M3B catalytic domain-containing protein n=1 Tax=Caulochytrium protostelioides TaxID=1555241 RepID=A0A4P9X2M3_9FUNG|nr:hypothetical protein CXG81DRAFT_15535 [Caulochytrium protostelioides]|eukprot:RKO98716.1 hypothetical protein CXG81DRAFT_15535 [Caulochytrium protostelioides]